QEIEPMPVITGNAKYPADITAKIEALGIDVTALDALSLAEQAGTSKAVNVVLMGVLSHTLDFGDDIWNAALEQCVPAKVLEINKKAFELGKNTTT
ncbi:MAG: 2-oxoacid:acceptor oxidoreductase family protein, partial [Huintestinicola sp.]